MNAGAFSPPPRAMGGVYLARVVSVKDPTGLSRVKVTLTSTDPDGRAELWARVATPFAGADYGAFFIPDVGEEVVVAFVGDSRDVPVVLGALWNGKTDIPEHIGGEKVDRWTLTGKNGARIAIVEAARGKEKIEIETPKGVKATLTDANGGSITLVAGGATVTMDKTGVSIDALKVEINASDFKLSAGTVAVDSVKATFSHAVDCLSLTTLSVDSKSYTPGLGNVW